MLEDLLSLTTLSLLQASDCVTLVRGSHLFMGSDLLGRAIVWDRFAWLIAP
jgi:hypothetical protein